MSDEVTPHQIGEQMMRNGRFSQSMGMKLESIGYGECVVTMAITEAHLNGFGVIHGGVTYSLADTALACAANSHNNLSMAVEVSMSYPASATVGDLLSATAEEISKTNKLAVYNILIVNQEKKVVGIFKGTVFRTGKEFPLQ
ncbi:MAG: hotdog fold thioesterase [Bacteroidetes bacterium]|nr:hotdog fold thioesterase [Bacteroidota bacterium]